MGNFLLNGEDCVETDPWNGAATHVVGPADAKVTLVEAFDYG